MAGFRSIRRSNIRRKELLPGSPEGTIFENDSLMKAVKEYYTYAAFDDFLKHYGWSEQDQTIMPFRNLEKWDVIYGLAKSFQEFEIDYDLHVDDTMFAPECFSVIPRYMERIMKAGVIETYVKWDDNKNELRLYAEIWSDFICGLSQTKDEYTYFVEGILDVEGRLKGPLNLVKEKNRRNE